MEYRKAGEEWMGKDGGLKELRRMVGREGEDTKRKMWERLRLGYRGIGPNSYYGAVKITKLPEQLLN